SGQNAEHEGPLQRHVEPPFTHGEAPFGAASSAPAGACTGGTALRRPAGADAAASAPPALRPRPATPPVRNAVRVPSSRRYPPVLISEKRRNPAGGSDRKSVV